MIFEYGVRPIEGENMGEKAFDAIRSTYPQNSKTISGYENEVGANDFTFDVEGRAVNIHSVPAFAHMKICGKDKTEIEETRDRIQEILTKEDERMALEPTA